ncbi:MAG: ABC transporter ATP-binding protein [Candidatus Tectomicrobia bacterium]|uniref:ABC transporter ATP-binding protein n=1 Tax=Tectimicrobiota bacterium TaxID=2528274 RepID=A0A932LZG5_UNCTE|nr:ABC transporter ATP-binding protein [Candidatus Tectomicrobia bacterium]
MALEGVTKTYWNGAEPVHALRGATVRVARGEALALMGPSGCGKTTLLNLMGGLDVPTAGQVWVAGHSLAAMGEKDLTLFRRRHVGIIFQFFHLLPTLTVWENVALPLHLNGQPAMKVEAQVSELLDRVHLGHRARQKAYQLSGGEMQRVALARALANDPQIVLADEPTGNLDSQVGLEVLALLLDLCRQRGKTLVLATHSAEVGARADRIVRLRDGMIENPDAA